MGAPPSPGDKGRYVGVLGFAYCSVRVRVRGMVGVGLGVRVRVRVQGGPPSPSRARFAAAARFASRTWLGFRVKG